MSVRWSACRSGSSSSGPLGDCLAGNEEITRGQHGLERVLAAALVLSVVALDLLQMECTPSYAMLA